LQAPVISDEGRIDGTQGLDTEAREVGALATQFQPPLPGTDTDLAMRRATVGTTARAATILLQPLQKPQNPANPGILAPQSGHPSSAIAACNAAARCGMRARPAHNPQNKPQ